MESLADYYVSTEGNDRWSGKLADPAPDGTDGPFATPARARDAIRAMRKAGGERDWLVLFRGGRYYLDETVVFGCEDGTDGTHTITYAAYPDETPVFSSGVHISEWKELDERPPELPELAKAKVWVADLPETLGRFRTLYDGDTRLQRARSRPFAVQTRPDEREIEGAHTRLDFAPGTLRSWENIEDVEIIQRRYVFVITILPLVTADEESGVAFTSAPGYGRLLQITGSRSWDVREGEPAIWVENILEALDTPGRWVLDTRRGKLYLWPLGDEPGDDIRAPALTELFRVEGEIDKAGPKDAPVLGLVFRDLTFCQADRGVVDEGDRSIQHDWEMIDKADALLRLRGAEKCEIDGCRFFGSGGSAIRLDLHCQQITVKNNEIEHLGGAGILLIGYGPGTKNVNRNNRIHNNHIHHGGEIYWHSHGIVLWQSGENEVSHNSIHHMPRKGICLTGARPHFFSPDEFLERAHPPLRENTPSIRWHEMPDAHAVKARAAAMPWEECDVLEWPEISQYLHTKDNLVELNEIYRVGQILADGSGLNVSGAGEGNLVRRNFLHHVFTRFHGVIRVDDYQRGTTFEENVIYRSSACGICTRHENYWINNVIAYVRNGCSIWVGERRYDGTVLRNNIVVQPSGELKFFDFSPHHYYSAAVAEHFSKMERGEIDRNLYFQYDAPDGASADLAAIRDVGYDRNSVYADPLFENLAAGDFRLRPDSPALALGITSIDLSEVGLTDEYPVR